MIDQTRALSPQTVTEPSGASAPSRQPAAVPFQSWVTSGNGEATFVSMPNWRGDQPAAKAASVIAVAAQVAAQATDADDMGSDGDVAAEPPEDAVASAPHSAPAPASAPVAAPKPAVKPAPTAQPEPVADYVSGNGEAPFVPVAAGDSAGNKGNVHAFAEGDEPTVWDLLDFINPLQHIPLVNLVYRELTGDKIGALPQIVGGAMLGGPIGALSAIVNVAVEETTGKDLGGQMMALLGDEQAAPPSSGIRQAQAPATTGSAGQGAAPDAAPAPKPRGHIDVVAPTPSDTFVPYSDAPAGVLPTAQAPAAPSSASPSGAAKSSKLKLPPRATPTPPVTAASLGRLSADAVKPAAVPLSAASASPVPPAESAAPGESQSDGGGDQEALATPGPLPSGRRAISASDSAQPQANPANTADFVAKFMSAMDKYDKASRLTPAQAQAAAAAASTKKQVE